MKPSNLLFRFLKDLLLVIYRFVIMLLIWHWLIRPYEKEIPSNAFGGMFLLSACIIIGYMNYDRKKKKRRAIYTLSDIAIMTAILLMAAITKYFI